MRAILLASLVAVGCGGASFRSDPTPPPATDSPPCYPTECGGTGDHALGASLVGIGVLVGIAALREIVAP